MKRWHRWGDVDKAYRPLVERYGRKAVELAISLSMQKLKLNERCTIEDVEGLLRRHHATQTERIDPE